MWPFSRVQYLLTIGKCIDMMCALILRRYFKGLIWIWFTSCHLTTETKAMFDPFVGVTVRLIVHTICL